MARVTRTVGALITFLDNEIEGHPASKNIVKRGFLETEKGYTKNKKSLRGQHKAADVAGVHEAMAAGKYGMDIDDR